MRDETKKARTVQTPAIPAELWMFWDGGAGWVLSNDDAPGGETYLTALTEQDAKVAAEYQNDMYDLNCIAVRVK